MSALDLNVSENEVLQQLLPTKSDAFADVSEFEETQQVLVPPTEHDAPDMDSWGSLMPLRPLLHQIDFDKEKMSYRLGRNAPDNDIVLPGINISRKHCSISWNGKTDLRSEVTILDLSTNGTFINDKQIGRGCKALLRQGDLVRFGPEATSIPGVPFIDYRFIYCHHGGTGLFAEYKIGNELGRGAFATVLKATHRVTGEVCAIKLINTRQFHLAKNHMIMCTREIEILKQLEHPNIVLLLEIFEDDSTIALVMEYVKGGNLLDYIMEKGGLSESDTRSITRQMCHAMAYIHKHKIAHRDLKPENVLLTNTIPVIAKIADFGLAKVVDNGTFLKTICGTPNYLAPEVVTNCEAHREYDDLVDSWAMGVMVFSMYVCAPACGLQLEFLRYHIFTAESLMLDRLTNRFPFISNANQDLMTRIRNRTVQWSILERMRVSHSCLDFVQKLLQANPWERMSLSDALHHPWLSSV